MKEEDVISSSREDTMLKRTVSSFCCACGAGEKKNTSLIYSKADSGMCCKDKAVRGAMY